MTSTRVKEKSKNRKRVKREDSDDDEDYLDKNYNEMSLEELQKLLKKKGLQSTTKRGIAILILESDDKGINLSITKTTKLQKFEPSIEPSKPTTLYSDESKPFFGVPMSVLSEHLFKYFKYPEKVALALTCKNFYNPLMKNICVTFHLFLQKLYRESNLGKGIDETWYWQYTNVPSLRPKIEKIIQTGLGITPMFVSEYCRVSSYVKTPPTILDKHLVNLFSMVCNNGSVDNYFETARLKEIQRIQQVEGMYDRVKILNQKVKDLGYEEGQGPFRIKGKACFSLWCNKKCIKPLTKMKSRAEGVDQYYQTILLSLRNYVMDNAEFDWDLLDDYLYYIQYLYNLAKSCTTNIYSKINLWYFHSFLNQK
jgi:hypothetical protein